MIWIHKKHISLGYFKNISYLIHCTFTIFIWSWVITKNYLSIQLSECVLIKKKKNYDQYPKLRLYSTGKENQN